MAAAKETIFRWPLDDFENCFQTAVFQQELESGDLSVEGISSVKFYLRFYPKGNLAEHKDSCAAYLGVRDFGELPSIRLKFDLWFENSDGEQLEKFEYEKEFRRAVVRWGWSKTCTQTQLRDLAKNGRLIVVCKVVPLDPIGPTKRAIETAPLDVLEKIAASFGSDKFADVEVRVDSKIFKVSKFVICSGSPVFCRMFTHDTKEKETGIVEIKKEDPDMIELLLRYLYSGRVEGLPDVAARLLSVADCYEVLHLVAMCLESLYNGMSVETVLCDLQLAFAHDHKGGFKQKFLQFTKQNFQLVRQQPDWTDVFMSENMEIVKEIMALLSP